MSFTQSSPDLSAVLGLLALMSPPSSAIQLDSVQDGKVAKPEPGTAQTDNAHAANVEADSAQAANAADSKIVKSSSVNRKEQQGASALEIAEIAKLTEEIRKHPTNTTAVTAAYNGRARLYLIQNKLDLTRADIEKVLAIDPNNAVAHTIYACFYQKQNQLDLAVNHCDRAITLDSKLDHAFFTRAFIRQTQGKLDLALADYNTGIELNPKCDVIVYVTRAKIHLAQGNLDASLSDCNRVIAIDPKRSAAYFNRAEVHQARKEFELAVHDLDQAIELSPKDFSFYFERARCHDSQGKLGLALTDYTQVINLNRHCAEAYNNRGAIFLDLGEINAAMLDFSMSIHKKKPEHNVPLKNRADAYVRLGKFDLALADLKKAKASTQDPIKQNLLDLEIAAVLEKQKESKGSTQVTHVKNSNSQLTNKFKRKEEQANSATELSRELPTTKRQRTEVQGTEGPRTKELEESKSQTHQSRVQSNTSDHKPNINNSNASAPITNDSVTLTRAQLKKFIASVEFNFNKVDLNKVFKDAWSQAFTDLVQNP